MAALVLHRRALGRALPRLPLPLPIGSLSLRPGLLPLAASAAPFAFRACGFGSGGPAGLPGRGLSSSAQPSPSPAPAGVRDAWDAREVPGTLVQYRQAETAPEAEDPLAAYLDSIRATEPWMQSDPDRGARLLRRLEEVHQKAMVDYNKSWLLRQGGHPVVEKVVRQPIRRIIEFLGSFASNNLPVFMITRNAVEHCLEQSERNEWYHFCGLVPEFHAEMHLAVIHIWMFNHRLLQILPPAQAVEWRTAMLENFWMFAQAQMSVGEGVHDMLVGRKLKAVQQVAMGAIQAYDHTFPMVALGNPAPFLASLWRNLYKADPMVSRAHTLQMLRYMLREMDGLKEIDPKHILSGRTNWGPPPSRLPQDIDEDAIDFRAYSAPMFQAPVKQ